MANEIKKQLLKEIDARIAKRKEAAARALNKKVIDAFVLAFIKNIEDINQMNLSPTAWKDLQKRAQQTLQNQILSFDQGSKLNVAWSYENPESPQVHAVTIRWSDKYVQENGCEPEVTLDITSMFL